jgi:hypothetical protein
MPAQHLGALMRAGECADGTPLPASEVRVLDISCADPTRRLGGNK